MPAAARAGRDDKDRDNDVGEGEDRDEVGDYEDGLIDMDDPDCWL